MVDAKPPPQPPLPPCGRACRVFLSRPWWLHLTFFLLIVWLLVKYYTLGKEEIYFTYSHFYTWTYMIFGVIGSIIYSCNVRSPSWLPPGLSSVHDSPPDSFDYAMLPHHHLLWAYFINALTLAAFTPWILFYNLDMSYLYRGEAHSLSGSSEAACAASLLIMLVAGWLEMVVMGRIHEMEQREEEETKDEEMEDGRRQREQPEKKWSPKKKSPKKKKKLH